MELAEQILAFVESGPNYQHGEDMLIIHKIRNDGSTMYSFWNHIQPDDFINLMHPAFCHIAGACIYYMGPYDRLNEKTQLLALAAYKPQDDKLSLRRKLEIQAYAPDNYDPHRNFMRSKL